MLKIKKADKQSQSLKFIAENNKDVKYLLAALAAAQIDVEDWRGWIECNSAKVRFNPKTRTFYYAVKQSDDVNEYLFDHLAAILAKYTHVPRDEVTVDGRTGSDLDIFMGGSSYFYCASWKMTEEQQRQTAAEFIKTPVYFKKIISSLKPEENGKDDN